MRRKCLLLLVVLLSAGMLSSCTLLPEEETVRTAPMVRSFVRPTYETVQVERGDLFQKAKISCSYVPVQTASLSFALDDVYIDRYMVQAGDMVEAGQLLAQLQLGDLEERIASVGNEIAILELQIEYQQKLYAIQQNRLKITTAKMEKQEKQETLEAAEKSHVAAMQSLQDSLQLKRVALKALQKDLADRQIRAPFSGTVTRVDDYRDGDRSEFGVSVITVVDSTRSIFRASTEHWDRFQAGDVYEIMVRTVPYQAVVTSETDLGLAPIKRVEGEKSYVYFALTEPSFELEDGDTGTVQIILDERFDALHVPSEAVSSANGEPIVYYLREDGMKAYKMVEAGVTIDGRTEILSGLTEGESIIAK